MTETAAVHLQKYASRVDDNPRLLAWVSGIEWTNIIPLELKYHKSCYRDIVREIKLATFEEPLSSELIEYIHNKVILNLEVLGTDDIFRFLETNGQMKRDKRTFLDHILVYFDTISLWAPKYGSSFLYNDTISKGEIIEKMFRKMSRMEEKFTPSFEDQLRNVCKVIRDSVLEMKPTYSQWPPSEEEVLVNKTVIPNSLETLIGNIVSANSKRLINTSKISSICHDIIYNVHNGTHRTSKHTALALSTKRQTGSKAMIDWLNRLGHCISYDEVRLLETSLAYDAVSNQTIQGYCPLTLQPSTFVTFVWDNNDINPESLSGQSMHVTNGIVIQMHPNTKDEIITPGTLSRVLKPKHKSFKAISTEMTPYLKQKRVNPTHMHGIRIEVEGEKQDLDLHSLIDMCWSMLYVSSRNVPSWTGFNYLIQTDTGEVPHSITYLPAINSSPTEMSTVLELLQQSKCKAEHLGLTETDIVLDQAIYAKAFEILLNPTYIDLKRFIVLRMGAFHTSCIFIAVIGKRFADAGLRDWIIEANLSGAFFSLIHLHFKINKYFGFRDFDFCTNENSLLGIL